MKRTWAGGIVPPASFLRGTDSKMMKLDSIAVDTELEQSGKYVAIPDWEGVSLGVRSLECEEYKVALETITEKLARKYSGQKIPPKERENIIGTILAKHILFDWKGITPDYSADVALEFLGSPRGRELSKKVIWAAQQVGIVNAEFEIEAVKN
jgi:hypothetical protein